MTVFFIVAALFFFESIHRLRFIQEKVPGPALWPAVVAGALILISLLSFLRKRQPSSVVHDFGLRRVILMALSILLFLPVWAVSNFFLASTAFLACFISILSGWTLRAQLCSFVLTSLIYLPFHYFLRIPFKL